MVFKIGDAGRKKAESLLSVIKSGELLKLDNKGQEVKLEEYRTIMSKDLENLGVFACRTYYKILHSYFNDLIRDTIMDDGVVCGLAGQLDVALSSIYRKHD